MSAAAPDSLPPVRIAPNADVDPTARLGPGTSVWQLATVRENAVLGRDCIVGRGAYVDDHVRMGDRVKLQNHALVYAPAVLEDGVFIGPAAVLTNDRFPRSVSPGGRLKRAEDWTAEGVVVREGASVGARAVVVPGVEIGRYAMVGAGAVVTRDVPPYALVVGVPARRIRWVGRAGVPLERRPSDDGAHWVCPETGETYSEDTTGLRQVY